MSIKSMGYFFEHFYHNEDFWSQVLKISASTPLQEEHPNTRNPMSVIFQLYLDELSKADVNSDYLKSLYRISRDLPQAYDVIKKRFGELGGTDFDLIGVPYFYAYLLERLSKGEDYSPDFLRTNLPVMPEEISRFKMEISKETVKNLKERINGFSVFEKFNILFCFYQAKSICDSDWIRSEAQKLENEFERYIVSKMPLSSNAIEYEICSEFCMDLNEIREIIKDMQK